MGPISMLFPNPAVKILEAHLWEKARKRYLGEHPADANDDNQAVMRKVKNAYRDKVDAAIEEAEQKVRGIWPEFKQVMTEELRTTLATVLHMSSLEWYSVEAGQLPAPRAIAVPYRLLQCVTAELLPQMIRKRIDFEGLGDAMLEALASYAVDQKFRYVIEEARRRHAPFSIGSGGAQFVFSQIKQRDAYFLGEEQHHSRIDMVLLSAAGESATEERINGATDVQKFDGDLKHRKEDRRFTGDGWEIEPEELKSWAIQP